MCRAVVECLVNNTFAVSPRPNLHHHHHTTTTTTGDAAAPPLLWKPVIGLLYAFCFRLSSLWGLQKKKKASKKHPGLATFHTYILENPVFIKTAAPPAAAGEEK